MYRCGADCTNVYVAMSHIFLEICGYGVCVGAGCAGRAVWVLATQRKRVISAAHCPVMKPTAHTRPGPSHVRSPLCGCFAPSPADWGCS